ncbi:cell wall-binding protein [Clostridium boliviensis]|uniref:Cell wall-binding protein n=1 Tax=Clostridium boliviensis TaxID=318465 RepID=A0ABU4GPR8_9CLOT|nr:cell wall-binding protein [Clostridium boliviensis]MDW2799631.1 cell wall-binding protein [Clostridium boliviensis]
MKKQMKLMAVLSAAGILTAAAPQFGILNTASTVYAKATGWVEEDGTWKFYEEGDYAATDSWKKYGNDWYYLNEDGEIATSQEIDEYYVDETGKRVSNYWVSVTNDSYWDSPDSPENYWHYYGKGGEAVVSKWQKINDNWYYFDDQGQMLTGKVEIEGSTYYLGDENDGAQKTGWFQLESVDENSENEFAWFYFDKDGTMLTDKVDKKINGNYYTFVNGEMQTGWYKLPVTATPSEAAENTDNNTFLAAGYQYYDESGARVDGWKEIEGIEGISAEGEQHWFFFKDGAPYFAEKGIEIFTVNSEKYGFNTKGEMQTGLEVVTLKDGNTANYYFADNGVIKTGKQTIYDEDLGENQIWYFATSGSKKGQGYTGILDDTLYDNGLRKEADADLKFAPYTLNGKNYLVNTNGSLQTASSTSKSTIKPELGAGFRDYKDTNEKFYVVDVNGVIQ